MKYKKEYTSNLQFLITFANAQMQTLHKNNQSTEANYKYKKNKICEKSHKNIKKSKKR